MKKNPIKQKESLKKDFSIKIELLVPVTLSYKVTEETPEKALSVIESHLWEKAQTSPPKHAWGKSKKLNAKVFEHGTIKVEFSKTYK